MDTTSLQLTLNKAREQFENGRAKACVETLKGALGDLKVGEPEWYRLRNDTSFLLARLSGLERERGMISEQNHMVEWNKLFHSTNQLLLDFEAGVKEMEKKEKEEEPGLYPAELVLGLDFEKTDIEEVKLRVSRIELVLNLFSGFPERITEIRAGSVIVKLNLYAKEIVKIRSLVKLGLVKSVDGFKVLDGGWSWIDGEDFVSWLEGVKLGRVLFREAGRNYLLRTTLRGTNLRAANLGGADLIDADLSGVDLSGADLSSAYLNGVNLRKAYLNGVNLRGAYLDRVNLSEVNLSEADLSEADLSGANLSGANLSGAILLQTIFHKEHRELLESMGIDISNVVFVDDDGTTVESLVEVE